MNDINVNNECTFVRETNAMKILTKRKQIKKYMI